MQQPQYGQDRRNIRRVNTPNEIAVRYDLTGVPLEVQLQPPFGRWHPVRQNRDTWRIDQTWWRARRVARTYYCLDPGDAPVFTIYRDDDTGVWYRQPYGASGEPPATVRRPLPPAKPWRSPARP